MFGGPKENSSSNGSGQDNPNLPRSIVTHSLYSSPETLKKYKHLFLLIDILGPRALRYIGLDISREALELIISCIQETATLVDAVDKYHQCLNREYFNEREIFNLINQFENRLGDKSLSKEKFNEMWGAYIADDTSRWILNLFFKTSGKKRLELYDNIQNASSDIERMQLFLDFLKDKTNQEEGSGFYKFICDNSNNRRFFPYDLIDNHDEEKAKKNAPENTL